ncbi:MAG: S-adenosylmethionine:tRNA ribosyltransferase-isomerase [Bdellovibrionales bacterium]|nr:S-adenosylmethionine:tRNA ribosyltransferase-isomerase [Bdellovibrionales bacterium]
MQTSDFDYDYPDHLVATHPEANFRTMCVEAGVAVPLEISKSELLNKFSHGDVLAINDTRVVRRRITTATGLEILFLNKLDSSNIWEVLFPARSVKDFEEIPLPGGVTAKLIERGLPQKLSVSITLDENYFSEHAELALPPYIQKARGERHNLPDEDVWYQTAWAKNPGSQAAPTASLHFTSQDIDFLKSRGVVIAPLTLHVGMGTFLPIKTETLEDHKMHFEWAHLPAESVAKITAAKAAGRRVWALGTTAVRTLESWAIGKLSASGDGDFAGQTDLFIRPGYRFEVVDGLLTNFHQPSSTLIALVSAFAGREQVLAAYKWAMAQNFRLFSYGDLTVWTRS